MSSMSSTLVCVPSDRSLHGRVTKDVVRCMIAVVFKACEVTSIVFRVGNSDVEVIPHMGCLIFLDTT